MGKTKSTERQELIEEIKKYMPVENGKLNWHDLCYFTKFDSFGTAFAFGCTWIEDINLCDISHLKMALFNLINFPNDDDNSNSKKAGYGKSQERIDYLKNYKDSLCQN